MTDDLATRFPATRRVMLFYTPRRDRFEVGTVEIARPTTLHVRFDAGDLRMFDDTWFRQHPTALRLVSGLSVA